MVVMTVFATVGYPGSGKGEAARVATEEGIPVVTLGDVIRNECRSRGLPLTEDALGIVATTLREHGGPAAIADRALPLVEATHRAYGTVLIDGIRGHAEVEYLQAALGNRLQLIAVDAPFDVRLERIVNRGRDPTATDAADLERRDRREEGYGMAEAFEAADVVVDNSDSLASYRQALRTHLGATPDP